MERTIWVRSNWNIRDPPVVHFDRFVITVGRTCFFPFEKIVVPSKAALYPAYKNNNQTRSGMDRSLQPECAVSLIPEMNVTL